MIDFADWKDFFTASAGSSATLTGLVFVGVSISLARILEIPKITSKAIDALVFLLLILTSSLVGLIPTQSVNIIGLELLVLTIVAESIVFRLDIQLIKTSPKEFKRFQVVNFVLNQAVLFPYLFSAILLLFEIPFGMYLLPLGYIFSFVKSLYDAWVLLIEINM